MRVAVVGAGGIGAGAIPALAGAGVGHLTIIDDDCVAHEYATGEAFVPPENPHNRQTTATPSVATA